MELLVKLANSFQALPISAKSSILDIWPGSGYVSIVCAGLIDVQLPKKNQISCGILQNLPTQDF